MKTLQHLLILTLFACGISGLNAADFRTVVIDAGHGGRDLGGQWGRVYEKHLALDTSVRLEKHLKRMGYRTVMTRRGDYFLTLPQRCQIANRYRDAIFVSVHFNYTWKQDVSGLETFYHNSEGQKIANQVQNCLIRYTRAIDRDEKFARFYVIRNTNMPSILVEGGFVSNEAERNRMKSARFREALARAIADGIQRYDREG
ncbi:MAG: N-acetylmuramoyl-L-alanine amidase [Verrucomicrobiia bacterium Tous-C5FEB]|jgi:N-acetylmuramoyl-L-alanine amidase|nr:MAG: N-acetylmuramoyl-L-alanine amidase [Verrucomicrobiae bacterium Tous-C5FEB]